MQNSEEINENLFLSLTDREVVQPEEVTYCIYKSPMLVKHL